MWFEKAAPQFRTEAPTPKIESSSEVFVFWEVAKRFDRSISPIRSEVKSIVLVGGSEKDSEIKQFLNSDVSVTYLSIKPEEK